MRIFLLTISILLFTSGCWKPAQETHHAVTASIYLHEALEGKPGKERLHALMEHGDVIVEFYAPWCPPCNMMHPIVDQLADEYKDKMKVIKVDIDQFHDISSAFEINGKKEVIESVPQFYFFKDGTLKDSFKGGRERDALQEKINKIFGYTV